MRSRKFLRYALKAVGWALAFLVFIWIAFWVYVGLNQDAIRAKVSSIIHEKTRGDVSIRNVSVSLIRTFPILSLQLSGVVVRDSLYQYHRQNLLDASEIYLKVSLPGLIRGESPIGKVIMYDGHINLITDSSGRSNEFVLKSSSTDSSHKAPRLPNLVLRNVYINYDNPIRKKLYHGLVANLSCDVKSGDSTLRFDINANALLAGLAFNTKRGTFLKGKDVRGRFHVFYNVATKELFFDKVHVEVDHHPYQFSGSFRFNRSAGGYNLVVTTEDVDYNATTKFLNDTLQKRLQRYSFKKLLDVKVTVSATSIYNAAADVRVQSNFDLSSVEKFADITIIDFEKGKASVDIAIISSALAKDTINGDLDGSVRVTDATVGYKPRNFVLTNCIGQVRFNNNDILIDTLSAFAGQTKLVMNGQTKNLFSMGQGDPGKLTMYWKVSSPFVHLKDFMPFLSGSGHTGKSGSIDKIFADADVYVLLQTPKMQYKNFTATNVEAQGVMHESGIDLQKVFFNHAKGSMELKGSLVNGAQVNPLTIHTRMRNLDIPLLFASFNNFGQDAVTNKNLKGTLSADIDFSTALTNKAELVTGGSKGRIDFILQNGELNNFEPLLAVGKKAFKKQDFTEIKFADLKNVMQVTGTAFVINPMEIRSTAFTLFVEGVYDIKNGTDMSIRVPLRNLTKDQGNTDLSDEAGGKRGLSVLMRAKTGQDGKLKLSWDPFRRSVKNKNDVKDSANISSDGNKSKLKVAKDSPEAKK